MDQFDKLQIRNFQLDSSETSYRTMQPRILQLVEYLKAKIPNKIKVNLKYIIIIISNGSAIDR